MESYIGQIILTNNLFIRLSGDQGSKTSKGISRGLQWVSSYGRILRIPQSISEYSGSWLSCSCQAEFHRCCWCDPERRKTVCFSCNNRYCLLWQVVWNWEKYCIFGAGWAKTKAARIVWTGSEWTSKLGFQTKCSAEISSGKSSKLCYLAMVLAHSLVGRRTPWDLQ